MGLVSEVCRRLTVLTNYTINLRHSQTNRISIVCRLLFLFGFFFDDNIITFAVVISLLTAYVHGYPRKEKHVYECQIRFTSQKKIFLSFKDWKEENHQKKILKHLKSVKISFFPYELLIELYTNWIYLKKYFFPHFGSLFSFSDFSLRFNTQLAICQKRIFFFDVGKNFPFRFHINFTPAR